MRNYKFKRTTKRDIVKIYNQDQVKSVKDVTAHDLGIDFVKVEVSYRTSELVDIIAPIGEDMGNGCYRVRARAQAE